MKKIRKVIITRGPINNPYAKIIINDRRNGNKDRRKLNSGFPGDKRKGFPNRRTKLSIVERIE